LESDHDRRLAWSVTHCPSWSRRGLVEPQAMGTGRWVGPNRRPAVVRRTSHSLGKSRHMAGLFKDVRLIDSTGTAVTAARLEGKTVAVRAPFLIGDAPKQARTLNA